MTEFLNHLRTGVELCGLGENRVLLGVSGGADSMAMLRGMVTIQMEFGIELCVGHLDHGLRGQASRADAAWIADLCNRLEIPVISGERAVKDIATSSGIGIEEAARQVRYGFLSDVAESEKCAHIAVAHTADDQAETILHHIIRGSGIAGLRGMPRCRPLEAGITLVRPLLDVSRVEIEEYLAALEQDYRHDASNFDEAFTRNRIRNSLLPMLEANFNPRVREALRVLGRQANEIEDVLWGLADTVLKSAVVDKSERIIRLNCDVLSQQPRHLIRQCLTLVWRDLGWPRQSIGFDHWDRLAELVLTDGAATLPGNIEARRRGNLLVLQRGS